MKGFEIDLIAIVGNRKVGLSDELGLLLSTHNVPIVEDIGDPDRRLTLSWVQRGSEESLKEAIKKAIPLPRVARRELLRRLRKNIGRPTKTQM